jgi:hypothetical protein
MEQIQLGDQVIRFDRERTRQAYSSVKVGDAERCGCSYCRNFAAQRSTAYPQVFRSLLDQLGVDPEKEGEVYESGLDGSLRMYGGWLYFSGGIVRPGERMTDTGSGFQYWFTDAKNLPKPVVDFGPSVLAVEFWTRLPWVILDQP